MGNFGTAVFTAILNNSQLIAGVSATSTALGRVGIAAGRVGQGLSAGLTLPIIGAAVVAVKRSADIENAWNEVRATYNLTDFSKVEAAVRPHGELANAVDNLSGKYGLNRVAVIENMGTLSQMGYVGKQATGVLTQGLEFAVAAGIPLEEGLSTATSLTNTFNISGSKLTDALRGLNTVENNTAAGGQDLADGLRRAGGAASTLIGPGFSAGDAIGSIAGGMAVFKARGQETMRSADALRAIFQRLYTTGPKVNALFKKMGVASKDANGALVPFPKLLGDIGKNFDKLNKQEQLQFTKSAIGVEFGPLFQMLIADVNKGNKSLFNTATKGYQDVKTGTATYARELEIRANSMDAIIGRIGAAFDKMFDAAQPVIKSVLKPLAEGLTNLATKFAGASPQVQRLVIIFAAVAAAIGPLLIIVGLLAALLSAISWPIVAIVVGVMALIAGIAMLVVWFRQMNAHGSLLMNVFQTLGSMLMGMLRPAIENFKSAFVSLLPALKILGVILGVVIVAAVFVLTAAFYALSQVFKIVATIIGWVCQFIVNIFMWLYHALVGGSIIPDLVNGVMRWFQMLASFFSAIMSVIRAVLVGAWNVIKAVVTTVASVIVAVVRAYLSALLAFWTAVWNVVRAVVMTVWNIIRSIVISALSGIRSAISSGMSAARSVIVSAMNAIRAIWTAVWNALRSTASSILSSIRSVISGAINSIRSVISGAMSSIRSIWSSGWNTLSSIVSGVMGRVRGIVSGAVGAIQGILGGISSKISSVKSALSVLPGFTKGGLVPGTGSGDIFPAMLEPGEFVLTKTTVRRIGIGRLNAINDSPQPLEAVAKTAKTALVKTPNAPIEVATARTRTPVNLANFATAAPGPGGDTINDNRTLNVNTNIYNPVAEPASDSVQRRLSRTAQLGLIGGRRSDTNG